MKTTKSTNDKSISTLQDTGIYNKHEHGTQKRNEDKTKNRTNVEERKKGEHGGGRILIIQKKIKIHHKKTTT